MASDEDERRRHEEESRIRGILGSRSAGDPKKKLELDKKRTEAENQRKTGNFGLVLLVLVVLSAVFAAVRFLFSG